MASISPGYNYDIFISYRQKDNKGDKWVSEFVDALKTELEATFKEEISVYFDINPHDGLLETHSVDKSLEQKLKCLIFIPIISRTYCDPKSFAWQNEFCFFNKLAKEDQVGRDIRLASGNVASRILPVKIHDLDLEDTTLLEKELGGVLRGIEFIHRASGVNRPLTSQDDQIRESGKVFYRDQINKVANAIKEITTALKKSDQQDEAVVAEPISTNPLQKKYWNKKTIISSLIAVLLIILGIVIIPRLFNSSDQLEKSIAVLPFRNDNMDDENSAFINGLMEKVLNNLQMIEDLRVISRTSVEQYRDTKETAPAVAKELGVNYIVEGSVQKYGNIFIMNVQLIEAVNKENHLWGNSYEREIKEVKDIVDVQSQIAEAIAKELKARITPEEKQLIEKPPTTDLTAWDFYQRGREEFIKYSIKRQSRETMGHITDNEKMDALERASNMYHKALEYDSTFALALSGLAWIYYDKQYWESYLSENFLDSVQIFTDIALSYDNQLSDAYTIKGQYYRQINNPEQAVIEFDNALNYNPNDWLAYYYKGLIYWRVLDDFVKSIKNLNEAIIRHHGEDLPGLLYSLGRAYLDIGFTDKAKAYFNESFTLSEDSVLYYIRLAFLEFSLENFNNAVDYLEKSIKIDTTDLPEDPYYTFAGQDEKAYLYYKKFLDIYEKTGSINLKASHRVGYAFWKIGKPKEAEYFFNEQIRYDTESIKLGRDIASWKAAHYDLAAVYAFLDDKEKAYYYLDEFDTKTVFPLWWTALIKHDPLFNNIRNEERFQKIVHDMEAKYQAEHEKVRKWLEENNML